MTKQHLFTAFIVLAVLIILFVGCQSYNNPIYSMGDNDAKVISNGGLVVLQGDYVYFVNGYNDYDKTNAKANWFGNVKKGAIMRVKAGDESGNFENIVPKVVMSSYKDSGFSIFDNFIYYVSPSTEESKSGEVKSDTIQFMRTRQDGQETRVLYQSDDSSLTYKYTPYGLLYYTQGNVYCKAYDTKHYKSKEEGRLLIEKATAVHFIKNTVYDRQIGETLGDYFLYTKESDAMYDNSNKLFIANAEGTVNQLLIDKYTYTDDPLASSNLAFKIDVVASMIEEDNLTIYYTKTEYTGTSNEGKVIGVFVNKINSSLEFDKSKEVKLSSSDATKVFPLGYKYGMIVYDEAIKVFQPNNEPSVYSGITSATVIGVIEGHIYYVNDSGQLFRYKTDGSENVDNIMQEAINTSFILPEIIGGDLYCFNEEKLNYLYKIEINTYNRLDEESLVKKLMGSMTGEDIEKLKEEEDKD